jgi:hypothetical protein
MELAVVKNLVLTIANFVFILEKNINNRHALRGKITA